MADAIPVDQVALTELILRSLTTIGALAAGVSAIVATAKYFFDRRASDKNNALQSYRAYLKLAFENPKLAHPKLNEIVSSEVDYTRYRWFVSNMLMAFEEIIVFSRGVADAEWQATIRLQLGYHSQYLNTDIFRKTELGLYESQLRKLILQVTEAASA